MKQRTKMWFFSNLLTYSSIHFNDIPDQDYYYYFCVGVMIFNKNESYHDKQYKIQFLLQGNFPLVCFALSLKVAKAIYSPECTYEFIMLKCTKMTSSSD